MTWAWPPTPTPQSLVRKCFVSWLQGTDVRSKSSTQRHHLPSFTVKYHHVMCSTRPPPPPPTPPLHTPHKSGRANDWDGWILQKESEGSRGWFIWAARSRWRLKADLWFNVEQQELRIISPPFLILIPHRRWQREGLQPIILSVFLLCVSGWNPPLGLENRWLPAASAMTVSSQAGSARWLWAQTKNILSSILCCTLTQIDAANLLCIFFIYLFWEKCICCSVLDGIHLKAAPFEQNLTVQ